MAIDPLICGGTGKSEPVLQDELKEPCLGQVASAEALAAVCMPVIENFFFLLSNFLKTLILTSEHIKDCFD